MSTTSTTPILNAQGQPIKSALRTDDDVSQTPPTGPAKAVQITEPEPEPLPLEEPLIKRQFSAGVSGKRLSGRPPINPSNSSRSSFFSQNSMDSVELNGLQAPPLIQTPDETGIQSGQQQGSHLQHATQKVDRASERLLAQVAEWLQREKAKRESKKPRRHHLRRKHRAHALEETVKEEPEPEPEHEAEAGATLYRTASIDSNSSDVSLHRLERIIQDGMAALGLNNIPQYNPRIGRRSSQRSKKHASRSSLHLSRAASSDTDYVDGDVLVPSCDAILDNTKTLKYGQGNAEDSNSVSSKRMEKEERAWTTFKNEIIRLAHTLRLKGWRRVALDSGDEISVERLSGALTNAVYVVTPPENLPDSEHITKKKPPKLLLRIYGPNVENLIDRDIELAILKRLARKRIGPRLLGTFTNGRFEQYFNAEPLTPELLRDPATSKQIAKRMRELHNGVDLLEEERDDGPTVFKNWDCWVSNVEKRTLFLDQQVAAYNSAATVGPRDTWKKGGFVCGTEWAKFKAMVDRYRQFLIEWYGGPKALREKLVFAHNDTQYGNILRVRPDDEKSPLLQPENQHKQLIVIDFEYASANLPGLEFANHFTEWAYNYHDPTASYACRAEHHYPTPEEQHRFIKAYLDHRPKLPGATVSSGAASDTDTTPAATPTLGPTPAATSSSSIVEFMLDARVPPGGWKEEERKAAELSDAALNALLQETRLWRAMNSAQWVAWGIVQAKIAGFTEGEADQATAPSSPAGSEGTVTAAEDEKGSSGAAEEEEEGFDYLSYAHERALFFWGDCVQMGLVKLEELPEGLRSRVKLLDY
ncbi:hypothetical protein N0V93_009210 [Gnomoniopsis smithogilvyi]|uniref:Choline kinase N-terminal domain-containing protein n=1 Tax=Gnomoniopsis smithogilvyi TaxID=1191159 RepID=A0A9W8YMR0_9PEZI|nr:hypothetical protein N0V93_009210 [Gnomoniopsis smithogilvyi]